MKALTTLVGILLTLAIIVALGYGLISGFGFVWGLYASLDSVVRIILLSIMFVMLFGIVVIAGAIKSAATKQSQIQLMQPKLELYEALINLYRPLSDLTAENVPASEYQRILAGLSGMQTGLQLVAAAQVININRQLSTALQNQQSKQQVASLFNKLVKAIRKDLGVASSLDESKLEFLSMPTQKTEYVEKQQST